MAKENVILVQGSTMPYPKSYDHSAVMPTGSRVAVGELKCVITSPLGSAIPVSRAIATGDVLAAKVPFHLGVVEDTSGLCKIILKPDVAISDETPVIVLDVATSETSCAHYLVIGYNRLEEISGELLDLIGLDTKQARIKRYHTVLENIYNWVSEPSNHDKPFKGDVVPNDTEHKTVSATTIPLSYSFINGHKVYKGFILGSITHMSESWRSLCDTITFMEPDEYTLLYISSGGGDTQTASSLISAMAQTQGTVVTIACGACASAAPVIWSKGHVRLITDNASMMVHNMAISDPTTKTTSHLTEMADFASTVAKYFLKSTVGSVGLATDEEIEIVVSTSKEYYHNPAVVQRRTKASVVDTDKDIWECISKEGNRE